MDDMPFIFTIEEDEIFTDYTNSAFISPSGRYFGEWRHEKYEVRRWWLVLISVLCVHAVLVLNYVYLQLTRKVRYTSRSAQVWRMVVFTLMPTLVIAEVIVFAGRTFLALLTLDPDRFQVRDLYQDARRYTCGILGMRVSPKPVFVDDEAETEAGNADSQDQPNEGPSSDPDTTEQNEPILPALADIKEPNDLVVHKQPWTTRTILVIIVLLVPVAQAIGTMVLYARGSAYHVQLGVDRRNLMAAIGSIICSLSTITLVCCRRAWSLQPLNDSGTLASDTPSVKSLVLEIIIASFISVAPFDPWDREQVPTSWLYALRQGFGSGGLVVLAIFFAIVWAALSLQQDRLKERMPGINWRFVELLATLPFMLLLAWIAIDNVVYVINDIAQIADPYSSHHWEDPLAKFLPFC